MTPNQVAVAFGVPSAATVGPEGVTIHAEISDTATGASEVLERAARTVGPLAMGFAHRADCRVLAGAISVRLLPGSDDLGTDWRFTFDVNGRGPSTVRSKRFGSASPLITPREILYHEWVPHCAAGEQRINLTVHVTQFQGIRDTGVAQTDPIWRLPCPGHGIHDLRVHVDGHHEHAEVTVRVLVQGYHAARHPG